MTGPEFQALREEAGLTKMALARLWGISRQAIQNFERSRTPIPVERAEGLRALLTSGEC